MSGHRFRRPLGPPRPRCGTSVTGGIYHGRVLRGQGGRARLRCGTEGRTVATRRRPSLPATVQTIAPRLSPALATAHPQPLLATEALSPLRVAHEAHGGCRRTRFQYVAAVGSCGCGCHEHIPDGVVVTGSESADEPVASFFGYQEIALSLWFLSCASERPTRLYVSAGIMASRSKVIIPRVMLSPWDGFSGLTI